MNTAVSVDPAKIASVKEFAHSSPLMTCRFDPTGAYVLAGSQDRLVIRWNLESAAKTTLEAHESWVQALAFAPDGRTVLSGGCDGKLIWWNATDQKPKPIRSIAAHHPWVRSIAVSPDGKLAATSGTDKLVKIWSIEDGKLVHEISGHAKDVYRVLFDSKGAFLFSADLKGLVKRWEAATWKHLADLDAAKLYHYDQGQGVDFGGVRDLAISPDGALIACSGLIEASNPLGAVHTPAIVLLDGKTGKEKLLERPKEDIKGSMWSVRFHPDGFLLAGSGGGSGGLLFTFKPDQVNETYKFTLPNMLYDVDLHPDGKRIASAHYDGKLRLSAFAPVKTT